MRKLGRDILLFVAAGAGLEIQGRLMDHVLTPLARSVPWLAWLQ